jgi:hypothetical protein
VVEEYLTAAGKTMDAEAAAEFEQHPETRIAITPRVVIGG